MRDCPSGAIQIIQLPGEKYLFSYHSLLEGKKVNVQIEKPGKKRFKTVIDLGKCLFCAQCVETCPRKALSETEDYELAALSKDGLFRTYEGDGQTEK
jgi:formate hydrogenlyase subunit 6/NADH:ubiquinone oxidoreductase subunit I